MLAFRYLFGLSVGALISLGIGGTATAQERESWADSEAIGESTFENTPVSGALLKQTSVFSEPRVFQLRAGNLQGFAKDETVAQPRRALRTEGHKTVMAGPRVIDLKSQKSLPLDRPSKSQRLAQMEENQPLDEYDESLEPVEETESLNPSSNPLQLPTRTDEVTVEEVVPITLEQAIELARKNNQTLKEARLNLNQAEEQLQEALGAEFPTLNLQADLQRSTSATSEIQAENADTFFQSSDGVTTDLNTTLQLNYNLYTGGQRPAQIRLAEAQVRSQELALEQRAEQLRLDVTNAYYAVQEADSQVEIAQAAVADAEQSLRDAQLLEQAGLGTRFDVLQAEVDLANEEQNLARARSQRRISQRQLVETLGLGQQIEVTAATPPEVAGTWDLSLEESIVQAYQNRSELEQQLQQRTIAQENQSIALAGIKPQVSLFTRYNVRDIIDDSGDGGTGAGDGLAIGAQMQWTLYDGGQSRARARQAQENEAIAANRFDQLRNQIRREVEQAFYNLQANEQNIDTARVAVEQGEESLRLARLRFQAGVGTQTDVINAQSALTQARGNLLTAIINYNRSLAALQRAVSNFPDGRLFDKS